MWWRMRNWRGLGILLLAIVIGAAACSTHKQQSQDETTVSAADPFTDPFFTEPPAWDDSVLQQSETLTEKPDEPEQPKTLLERGEGLVFSTLMIGASLAKLAMPFMGF
ncbi:MAG TPA: hypothetical protein VNN62_12265 [Methylomirabilota bacterium]|nr:hypothetical protein [Methylomirabilota bacterium]